LSGRGIVVAAVVLENGEVVQVDFTMSAVEGITVAQPSPDIFSASPATLDEVRHIVAAVIAFNRASEG
jgi:hypothetical protein